MGRLDAINEIIKRHREHCTCRVHPNHALDAVINLANMSIREEFGPVDPWELLRILDDELEGSCFKPVEVN